MTKVFRYSIIIILATLFTTKYSNAQELTAESQSKIEALNKEFNSAVQSSNFKKQINTLSSIAGVYFKAGIFSEQSNYLEQALSIAEQENMLGLSLKVCQQLTFSYKKQNLPEQTINVLKKSLKITERLGNKQNIIIAYSNLGAYQYQTGKYADALANYENAYKIAFFELQDTKQTITILRRLSSAAEKAGNQTKYLKYSDMLTTMELNAKKEEYDHQSNIVNAEKNKVEQELANTAQKLHNTSGQLQIVVDSLKYAEQLNKQRETELKLKDSQTAELNAKLANERNMRYFLIAIIVLTLFFSVILLIMYRQKIRANILLEKKNIEITKQKEKIEFQATELKIQRDKYQKLSNTKDKFFSVIAHDLKNPFNSIIGFSELLLDEYDNLESKDKLDFIEMINKTAIQTNSLLINLLQWARSQTGKINFNPKYNDIKLLVENNIDLMKQTASKKDIQLISNIDETIEVAFDKNMIDTVLRNLIANAIKFTKNKGSVSISCKKDTDFIELHVTDTGIGIKQEKIPLLFDQESYYSTNGTQNEAGTGLGLSLCKEFIDRHNGDIIVESKENIGTTFKVRIPLILEKEAV